VDLALRHRASQRAFLERFGTRTVQPHGSVIAAVTPAAPDRSLPNSIAYEDPADVLPALEELERIYRSEGIRAWTVWVRPGDDELAAALEEAGHVFDGQPALMGAPLDELDLSATLDGVEAVPVTDWRVVGEINDRAYGVSGLAETFGAYRGDDTRGWLAVADGRPLATVTVLEHEGDAFLVFVATEPDARGRGLWGGLMSHALRLAAGNGCTTTTLEGSQMGEPVYARMGYRTLGRLRLMERRLSNDSAQ
jgi:GNAT superfamily N-acetyltransferase